MKNTILGGNSNVCFVQTVQINVSVTRIVLISIFSIQFLSVYFLFATV